MVGVETGTTLTRDSARALCARYVEARNREELTLLDEVYSPDVVVHDCSVPEPIRGLEALRAYYRGSHEGLPGLHFDLGNPMVDGEWMAVRWVLHGTHSGNLRGLPATGRAVRVEGMMVDRVVDGRIVEEWVDYDTLGLFFQLGFALVAPQDVPKS
ncbi:MAG: ester cyclase [Thermoanaerobaculia bacterium]|nr:ester cyclase [Thermoanaerobaculia bacterium]